MAKTAKSKIKAKPVQPRSHEGAAAAKTEAPNAPKLSKWDVIDRSKPVNIIGGYFHGATHTQRGSDGRERYYDQQGRRVWLPDEGPDPAPQKGASAPEAPPVPVKEVAAASPPAPAADDPDDIPEDEKGTGPVAATVSVKAVVAAKPNGKDDDEVNLTAWATVVGENYRWGQIRDAISARYSKIVTNQSDALAFLIEQGVATSEAVAAKWAIE